MKPKLKGPDVLLRFRDSLGFKKAKNKEKINSGLEISFGPSNRFGLNDFGLTMLYCSKLTYTYLYWSNNVQGDYQVTEYALLTLLLINRIFKNYFAMYYKKTLNLILISSDLIVLRYFFQF